MNSEDVTTVGEEEDVEIVYSDSEAEVEVVEVDDDGNSMEGNGLQEETINAESSESQQLGYTPTSGKGRFSSEVGADKRQHNTSEAGGRG